LRISKRIWNLSAGVFPAPFRGISERIPILLSLQIEDFPPLASGTLKLPAACGGESSIFKEENNYIRSLTPGQAPGTALAERFNFEWNIKSF
jgi:hypothetical protein